MKTIVVMTAVAPGDRPDLTKYFTNMRAAKKFALNEANKFAKTFNVSETEIITETVENNNLRITLPRIACFNLTYVNFTA